MTQRLLLYISFILGFLIGGVGNANAQISVSAPSKVSAYASACLYAGHVALAARSVLIEEQL